MTSGLSLLTEPVPRAGCRSADGVYKPNAPVGPAPILKALPTGLRLGVKNPIGLAFAILQYARQPDPLGRIPPLYEYSAI